MARESILDLENKNRPTRGGGTGPRIKQEKLTPDMIEYQEEVKKNMKKMTTGLWQFYQQTRSNI